MRKRNLSGERFGRLLVLGEDTDKNRYWKCICDCGNEKSIYSGSLISGKSKSCGCLLSEVSKERSTKHGKFGTKEHNIWMSMCSRARYEGENGYYYQELNVKVCDRWLEKDGRGFVNFLEDMGECPEGLTLDRIDNQLGYFPENCQWANRSQQSRNQRRKKSNESGRTGVFWRKDQKKWRVVLKVNGIRYNLGQYDSYGEACRVCSEKEMELLGYSREKYQWA